MSTFLRSLKLSLMVACMLLFLSLNAQDCLPGYTYLGAYNGHHYYLSQNPATGSEAHDIAEGLGGYLASIGDAAENTWVSSHVPYYVIIGLNDADQEGVWQWQSGESFGYSNWLAGEPNNQEYGDGLGEDFVVINFPANSGKWNDIPLILGGAPWKAIYVVEMEDADCDCVSDAYDICPGGNDKMDHNGDGVADCSQLLAYEAYSPDWYCARNKIQVCHNDGNPHTICISKNALEAHFNHGDQVGPCSSCSGSELRRSTDPSNRQVRNEQWNPIGGDEPEKDASISIAPNPASHFIDIRFSGLMTDGQLIIMDVFGKLLFQSSVTSGQESLHVDLNANGIVKGSYITLLKTDQAIVSSRFMVTN